MSRPVQPEEEQRFITRRGLAARWGTSVKTVIRKENAGKLTPRREINQSVRYAMSQVLAIEEGPAV